MPRGKTTLIITDPPQTWRKDKKGKTSPAGSFLAISSLADALEESSWKITILVSNEDGVLLRERNWMTKNSKANGKRESVSFSAVVAELQPRACILSLARRYLRPFLAKTQRVNIRKGETYPKMFVIAAKSAHDEALQWAHRMGFEGPEIFLRVGVARILEETREEILRELTRHG